MKKTISTMLIGSMLLMPLPVLATDEDNYIHSLSFEKIEDELKARNQALESSRDDLADGASKIDKNIRDMKAGRDALVSVVDPIINAYSGNSYIEGMKITDIQLPTQGDLVAENTYLSIANFLTLINTYDTQIEALDKQDDSMWKSWLQIEQGEKQTIWGAQQLYLSYFNLEKTRDNLQTNLTLLQKKLTALQLKESLGLATHIETLGTESQIKELSITLDSLKEGLEALKGQMNVMLGQDFDTELTFSEPSSVSQGKLSAMDYEEDLDDALVQSFSVRLQEESDRREDAERNFTLAFHKAYQNVQDKKKALELEQYKLSNEQMKYDQAVLMNSLGLTSNLDFEGLRSLYLTQVNKVKTAEQDVLQAYTAYDWMKKGLTVSTGASASGASSSSSSASSSQASGAATSGMGF